MKRFALLFLLSLAFNRKGNAQYLFSIAELIEIAETRDRQTLDALMKTKKFAFDRKRTNSEGQVDYIYLDQNPRGSDLIGKVNVMIVPNIASNALAINTGSDRFQFHMSNEVLSEGFVLDKTKANGDREYSKVIGSKKWCLTVRVPIVEPRATVHMATFFALPYAERTGSTLPPPARISTILPEQAKEKIPEKVVFTDMAPTLKTRTIPAVGKPGYSPFPTKTVESSYHRLSSRGDTIGRARAFFSFPEFTDDKLNDLLRRKIAGDRSYEMEAMDVTMGYRAMLGSFKDEEIGATLGSEDRVDTVSLRAITSRLYFLENKHYSYGAGAAHGQYSNQYWIYDTQKRIFLKLTDLFTASGVNSLKTLAEREFRKNEGLGAGASLCKGYLFDKCQFQLAENIRFDPRSVSLIYNPYEAKAFAYGIWAIKLNYQQVLPLMKPEYAGAVRELNVSVTTAVVKSKPENVPVKAEVKPTPNMYPLGGRTPEELGKILLRALQNRDLKTWERCIHPDHEGRTDQQRLIRGFNDVIDELEQGGLTDWSAVRFSRVTFKKNDHDNRKVASYLTIEFLYKSDFLGEITLWSASTQRGGSQYFIWGGPLLEYTYVRRKTQLGY